MTKAEAQQLLSYVNARDEGADSGWYYAPKKDFERRHGSLKAILERVLSLPQSDVHTKAP